MYLEMLLGKLEHSCGRIYPRQLVSFLSQWNEHASATARQFQNATATEFSEVLVHVQIFAEARVLNIIKWSYQIIVAHRYYFLDTVSIDDLPVVALFL